jgi:putative oxidoreductase
MIDSRTAPAGILFLRISLGILFLAHWSLKVFVFTPAGTVAFFGSVGLPPVVAYFDLVVEFLGAIALILGIWARLAALVLVPVLLGAIITVHGAAGFFFTNKNGGWEYPAFWALALIVLALLGDGAFAMVRTPVPFLEARRASA